MNDLESTRIISYINFNLLKNTKKKANRDSIFGQSATHTEKQHTCRFFLKRPLTQKQLAVLNLIAINKNAWRYCTEITFLITYREALPI